MSDSASSSVDEAAEVADAPSNGVAPPRGERTYGGLTAEQRRAKRRAQLIEAARELFGTKGFQSTTVRALVKESGLGERYFYESFADLEELLIALLDEINSQVLAASLSALGESEDYQARNVLGMTAWARAVTADPRNARVILLESVGVSERVERSRRRWLRRFAEVIVAYAPSPPDGTIFSGPVIALGLVGAVHELTVEWYSGDIEMTLDEVILHAVVLFEGVRRLTENPPDDSESITRVPR